VSEHATRQPRSLTTWLALVGCGLMLLVLGGSVVFLAQYGSEQDNAKQSEATQKQQAQAGQAQEQGEKKDLAAEVKKVCDAGGAPAASLTKQGLCKKAVDITKEPPVTVEQGEPGKKGDKGDPAPPITDAQILRAVNTYCANGRCDAKSPTPQQVAAAVTTYCNARAECTPPKPADGEDGEDGTDGENATAAQVATAVADFCSQDSLPCKSDTPGPAGANGTNGTNGTNGAKGDSVQATTQTTDDGVTVTLTYVNSAGVEVGLAGSFMILNGKDGAAGPPGPTCEPGSTPQKQRVLTQDGIEPPVPVWIIACVLDDQNP
jgi:hypothetical protein